MDQTVARDESPGVRWRRLAAASLGGQALATLERPRYDPVERPAIAFAEDLAADSAGRASLPGHWPFRRHARAAGAVAGWELRQIHADPDPVAARRALLEDLAGGVSAVELR